jgi:hypothetical protein
MAYISQEEKKELAPAIKAVLKKYNMKGSISIKHYSSLVVTLSKGALKFNYSHGSGYAQINSYHVEDRHEGTNRDFLIELVRAMKGSDWHDRSDAMIDYFDISYYIDINVGKWNKPYIEE